MALNEIRLKDIRKREIMLMMLVASYAKKISDKYPATKPHFNDMEAEIIALTVDWD